MMVESKLDVFADLPTEKIHKLGDFIGNDVISKIPDPAKISAILGDDHMDIDKITLMNVFCDFILSKKNPNQILQIIEKSKLPSDKIKTLKNIVQNIHEITDSNKTNIASNFLKTWIDLYVHDFIMTGRYKKDIDEEAFEKFLKTHLNDPKYAGKYVAFVHGKFQKCGSDKRALIKEMFDKFGGVDMHVSKVTSEKRVAVMATPRFV